jgi:hypothetical protein
LPRNIFSLSKSVEEVENPRRMIHFTPPNPLLRPQ